MKNIYARRNIGKCSSQPRCISETTLQKLSIVLFIRLTIHSIVGAAALFLFVVFPAGRLVGILQTEVSAWSESSSKGAQKRQNGSFKASCSNIGYVSSHF